MSNCASSASAWMWYGSKPQRDHTTFQCHFSKPDCCFARSNFPTNVALRADGHCHGNSFTSRLQSFRRPFSLVNVDQILSNKKIYIILDKYFDLFPVLLLNCMLATPFYIALGVRHYSRHQGVTLVGDFTSDPTRSLIQPISETTKTNKPLVSGL